VALIALGVDGPAFGASEDQEPPSDNVRLHNLGHAFAVRQVLRRAGRALVKPDCQRVFREFSNASGQPLQDRLDAEAKSGDAFLASLLFYEGSSHPRCDQKHTLAVARPGSRVVLLCTPQFFDVALRSPRLAASVLIHEELHALGLGENPPSSSEITARVAARCAP
jgi:hypothetical protein